LQRNAAIYSIFAQGSEVGECLVRDEEVGGSNPLVPTRLERKITLIYAVLSCPNA
jgi:hypothetical protein